MDETVLLLLSVFQWYDGEDDDCEEVASGGDLVVNEASSFVMH